MGRSVNRSGNKRKNSTISDWIEQDCCVFNRLNEEEKARQLEAVQAFNLKPYIQRMLDCFKNGFRKTEIGGIAIDLAKEWMAQNVPHESDWSLELDSLDMITRKMTTLIGKILSKDEMYRINKIIDPRYNINYNDPQNVLENTIDSPLDSLIEEYTLMWLSSYMVAEGLQEPEEETFRRSLEDNKAAILQMYGSEEAYIKAMDEKYRKENETPFSETRIDLQRYADMLYTAFIEDGDGDLNRVYNKIGLALGLAIYDEYEGECKDDEAWEIVVSSTCKGICDKLILEFGNSRVARMTQQSPMYTFNKLTSVVMDYVADFIESESIDLNKRRTTDPQDIDWRDDFDDDFDEDLDYGDDDDD